MHQASGRRLNRVMVGGGGLDGVGARRKVTEGEAERLVSEWRASKRALPDGWAARGIGGRSLRYWVDRLDQTPFRFTDVPPRPPSALGL